MRWPLRSLRRRRTARRTMVPSPDIARRRRDRARWKATIANERHARSTLDRAFPEPPGGAA